MPEIELKTFLEVSVEVDRNFEPVQKTDSRIILISDFASTALSESTDENEGYKFEACVLDVGQLTGKEWALGSEIHDAIISKGGRLLSVREGFEIRTQYINQPDEELLWVAMTPIKGMFDEQVLQIERESRCLHLRPYSGGLDGRWPKYSKFIFAIKK